MADLGDSESVVRAFGDGVRACSGVIPKGVPLDERSHSHSAGGVRFSANFSSSAGFCFDADAAFFFDASIALPMTGGWMPPR
jgi:hypothetical protein